ncbi:MAG: AAA family ATPase, partial [Planctomycetes bacterium]|nr:AAA family ATPase [Planctomycetota bacterium]
MGFSIAISGKGGTGKTTLSAMLVRLLIGKSPQAVLAVDGDPNSCLGITLGVEPETT